MSNKLKKPYAKPNLMVINGENVPEAVKQDLEQQKKDLLKSRKTN
jgi:hypothetical protein